MYFKYKKINIYYEKIGNSPNNLIILPGWGDNRKTFNQIISNLKNKYTIYIFDYPGFGNSPFPNKDLTIYDYADIIYKFIIDNKIINVNILSHSFGGRISIILSGYYKLKINKLILMNSAGIKHKNIFLLIKTKIYKILKKKFKNNETIIYKLNNRFSSNDYKSIPNNMKKTFINVVNEDLKKYIKNIKSDTLIIAGEKDDITPLKDSIILNKLINDSGLIIIKNVKHFSYLEYPYIIDIINEFI